MIIPKISGFVPMVSEYPEWLTEVDRHDKNLQRWISRFFWGAIAVKSRFQIMKQLQGGAP